MGRKLYVICLALPGVLWGLSASLAQDLSVPAPDGIREGGTLSRSLPAPLIADPVEAEGGRERSFPEQPPTIPHKIRGYQTDINANRCIGCHSRSQSAKSGAPAVAASHYLDRDQQRQAELSPRRYFCLQCHVPQADVKLKVDNTFMPIDSLSDGGSAEDKSQ